VPQPGDAPTWDMQARLALLQAELASIETAIRSFDTIGFQIKGWAVTAGLAIGGFAITEHKPALLFVGFVATIGFWLVDCQFKSIQRPFIARNRALARQLRQSSIASFLSSQSGVKAVGVPDIYTDRINRWSIVSIINYLRLIRAEAILPNVFVLYLFILIALVLEMIFLR
jgi:hypothetical protein